MLGRALVGADVLALVASWVAVFGLPMAASSLWWLAGYLAIALSLLKWQRLYQARIARSWSLELSGIVRAAGLLGMLTLAVPPAAETASGARSAQLFAATVVLLVLGRSAYRAILRVLRRRGRFTTSLVVIGHGRSAADLVGALTDDPAAGFRVAAVAGPGWDATSVRCPHLATDDLDPGTIRRLGATGAVIDVEGLPPGRADQISRRLLAAGLHVQLSTGLRTLHPRRVTVSSLSYEALLYLEPPTLSPSQLRAKRLVDIVGATIGLVLFAPVLALVALAIKLEDGGPVLFRQRRVGQEGRTFDVFKLRTMVVDAERRLAELAERNERDGPLFKLDRDPRITRVGWLLRASSLDEVPQFLNVLRGDMSLVGPRPALPHETEAFDEELLGRSAVPPGITGLWQVEARDNASFDAYRRLDLFYVRNWSLGFDLTLLAVTPAVVAARAVAAAVPRHKPALSSAQATD